MEFGEGWVGIFCIWWRGECIFVEYGFLDFIFGNFWFIFGCFFDGVKGLELGVLGSCFFSGRELLDLIEFFFFRVGGMCFEFCCCSSVAIWLMFCWFFLFILFIWLLFLVLIFFFLFFFWLNFKNLDWKLGIFFFDLDEFRFEFIFFFVIFMFFLEFFLFIELFLILLRLLNIFLFLFRFSLVFVFINLMMLNVLLEFRGKENENFENILRIKCYIFF